MRNRTLYVFGCGGFGREVMPLVDDMIDASYAAGDMRKGHAVFLVDDRKHLPESGEINQHPVQCISERIGEDNERVVIAVGDPVKRKQIADRLERECKLLSTFAFSVFAGNAIVRSPHVDYGDGAIVCAFALISPNVKIGRHFHANIYSYVAHDAHVGDFVTLAPKAAVNGNVTIGDCAYIGTGAVIREGIKIGQGAIVGAGAVVVKDVPAYVTVVGNPARPLVRNNQEKVET